MKKHLLIAAAVLISASALPVAASGQTAAFIYNDNNGVPNSGSYTPGSSFTFSIQLTFAPGGSVANLEGLSYWFEQQNPNAPFNFAITNRNVTGSQFTDLQTPGLTYPQNMTPQNADDLGAFLPGPTGVSAGNYFIANLTISISGSAAVGNYVIENTTAGGKTSVITDDVGHTFAIPQATYTISVVPEPSSLALFGAGAAIFGAGACRRFGARRG
ncbi:MAG TPA: PEP-CTERM sorting domain-containing protein [Chthoniobacterales bacterium]